MFSILSLSQIKDVANIDNFFFVFIFPFLFVLKQKVTKISRKPFLSQLSWFAERRPPTADKFTSIRVTCGRSSKILQRFKEIEQLPDHEQNVIIEVVTAYIRDFKAKQNYAV